MNVGIVHQLVCEDYCAKTMSPGADPSQSMTSGTCRDDTHHWAPNADVVVGFLPGPRQESYIYVSKPRFLGASWRCIRQVIMLIQCRAIAPLYHSDPYEILGQTP